MLRSLAHVALLGLLVAACAAHPRPQLPDGTQRVPVNKPEPSGP